VNRNKELTMIPKKTDRAMAHNVYSVNESARHYIWGEPSKEETLLDKVCAGAAFVACIVVLMFMG
jgi:hypothetical protein